HAQLLHARECQASAETAVRHQPKLCKASAEHVLSCFSRNRTEIWSRRPDSDRRPAVYKTAALPAELRRRAHRLYEGLASSEEGFSTKWRLLCARAPGD